MRGAKVFRRGNRAVEKGTEEEERVGSGRRGEDT